ncbi:type II secretion system GspH family protein [Clostridium estertheticum]|uniref:type IV pilus modification PilV family protein n=1 Tax=Clostridium estertheticum TaxID=238834 RepID=UPI0013E97500|nr:type II secretion system protein [Clostridium estertheticum]MBZ9688550.1 type II secretion system GspH family protein [Clostridium estertheticum]
MIKYKKYLKNKKGFTLIEVILSIALLGIISIAFLTMFTSGIVGITNSGKKSVSHYTAQNQIESNINDLANLPSNVVTSTKSITLTFPGNTGIVISGRQVDVTYTYGSRSKILTTFTTN